MPTNGNKIPKETCHIPTQSAQRGVNNEESNRPLPWESRESSDLHAVC